jgi:tetratricopeptide (TPR) repeat protein
MTQPFDSAPAPDPGFEARFATASAAFGEGLFHSAQEKLAQCVAERPDHVPSRYGLAMALARLGRDPDATQQLRAVLEREPGHDRARMALAGLLERNGDRDGAFQQYDRIASADPTNQVAREGAARTYRAPTRLGGAAAAAPAPLPPQPRPVRTEDTSPIPVVRKRTLADDLDTNNPGFVPQTRFAGELCYIGGRRLLSHGGVWAGGLLLLLVPVVGSIGSAVLSQSGVAAAASALTVVRDAQVALAVLGAAMVVLAVASWVLTTYRVYERRIDISHGALRRTERAIWLYDVGELRRRQTPLLMIAGSSAIVLTLDGPPEPGRFSQMSHKPPELTGFGSYRFQSALLEELQGRVLTERRTMKKQFI